MENIHTAKLFMNGNSQAVRLPKEYRFNGGEVLIYREGERVILQPVKGNWRDFFLNTDSVSGDFMKERKDEPAQSRKLF